MFEVESKPSSHPQGAGWARSLEEFKPTPVKDIFKIPLLNTMYICLFACFSSLHFLSFFCYSLTH